MKYTKYFLLMMFLMGSLAWAQEEARELASSNWGINIEPSVVTKAFSKEAVRDFLEAMANSLKPHDPILGSSVYEVGMNEIAWAKVLNYLNTNPGMLGTAASFKWADVDDDGIYELIVTMDFSGRAFYNNLYIVKQITGAYRRQVISINNADRIIEGLDELRNSPCGSFSILGKVAISDLDQDGTLELIVPIKVGGSRGSRLTPIWPSIYKWELFKYIEADERFKSFYEEILLPNIDKRIEELSRGKSEEGVGLDEELTTEWVIRDRIVRFLGRDPQAGLQRAIEWTKSDNVVVRQNAALVFSEIQGEEADRYLEKLAADPNIFVSCYSKYYHDKRREKAKEQDEK